MADNIRIGLGIAEVIGNRRDEILRLAERYGASDVRVFGSVARGEAQPDSDLDLLVEFKPDYTFFDLIGLQQEIEELLARKVDIIQDRLLREEFVPYVLRDAKPL